MKRAKDSWGLKVRELATVREKEGKRGMKEKDREKRRKSVGEEKRSEKVVE